MFQPDKLKEFTTDRATARKVEAAPFTLESLIAWLEKQPADVGYCFTNDGECLWGRYTAGMGGELIRSPAHYAIGSSTMSAYLHADGWQVKIANGLFTGGNTFGAALTRAQAALERL